MRRSDFPFGPFVNRGNQKKVTETLSHMCRGALTKAVEIICGTSRDLADIINRSCFGIDRFSCCFGYNRGPQLKGPTGIFRQLALTKLP